MKQLLSLGIDTSNYKTSIALTDPSGEIIKNIQKFLEVKKGERGLRQSVALFQHVNNIPDLMQKAFDDLENYEISCVSVSSRPRSVDGSYMPVFNAGISVGKSISSALGIPYYEFSHQDGHIEAVRHYSKFAEKERFISFHFSGGTTEAVLFDNSKLTIVGGTKDIAFGQVLDRVGVTLGMEFPCGQELDILALNKKINENIIPQIKCKDGYINLSGIETFCQRNVLSYDKAEFAAMLFERIGQAIVTMVKQIAKEYNTKSFLFAGGVSSSEYIRNYINMKLKDFDIVFGSPQLSTDNAVGISLLGGKNLWP